MNAIQKHINEQEELDLSQYLDRIELTYYDNEFTSNEEENKKYEAMYYDMIDGGEAFALCRGAIDNDYIKDVFLDENIMGFIATIDGEYVGFIMFKKPDEEYDELYLSLIGTRPKLGMPLGQILISVMEEVAEQSNIDSIIADSVGGALPFYEKNGWEVLERDEEDDTYLIEKQIKKSDDEEYELVEEDEDFKDSDSYFQRVLDYTYSFF